MSFPVGLSGNAFPLALTGTLVPLVATGTQAGPRSVAGGEHQHAPRPEHDRRPDDVRGQQVKALAAEVKVDRTVEMADQEQAVRAPHGLHAGRYVGPELDMGAAAGLPDQAAQGRPVRERAKVETRAAPVAVPGELVERGSG